MNVRNSLMVLCATTALSMTACSGGTPVSTLPQGQPSSSGSAAQTATRSYALGTAGGTYDLPPLNGFSGSLALSAPSVPANTFLQLTSSLQAPASAPILAHDAQRRAQNAGTLDVYFYTTLQLSQSITLATLPGFSVKLPATIKPSGLLYFYAISNVTPTNDAKVQFRTEGPAMVSGQIVTFAPSSAPLTFQAGMPYTIAFYAISAIGPVPSPIPTLNGDIFIANTSPGVTTYTASGKPTTPTISLPSAPGGIAVDAAGKIYVTLPGFNLVRTYTRSGAPTTPTISAGLNSPEGIAVDAAGKIYVTNGGGFPPHSYPLTTYKPDGTQTTPIIEGVGPGHVAVDAAGKIYVADGGVTTYTPDGKPTTPTTGNFYSCGVALDATGNIYDTVDFANDTGDGDLEIYRPNGTLSGASIAGLKSPCAVAVDPAGKIYIVNNGTVNNPFQGNYTLNTYTANRTPTTPVISVPGAIGIAVH